MTIGLTDLTHSVIFLIKICMTYLVCYLLVMRVWIKLGMLSTANQSVDDILGMLSSANQSVNDILGMLSTDDEGV